MSKARLSVQDIVNVIAGETGVSKAAAEDFFRAWMTVMEEALLAGETIRVKGL